MRSVRIHGALLLVVLLWAFQTWTRDQSSATARERTLVWTYDAASVEGIRYEAGDRWLEVTRRIDGDEAFLWGLEARPGEADTLAFPLGIAGDKLVRDFAALTVVRDLGTVPEDRWSDFGLDDPSARIRVDLRGEVRDLLVGDSPYGGSDRFALDTRNGAGFVIPEDVIRPLEIGSGALRERRLHAFPPTEVGEVVVRTPSGDRVMRVVDPGMPSVAWAPPDLPDRPDADFGSFMERVELLAISGFEDTPSREALELLLRVEYRDQDGEFLGFLELLRGPDVLGGDFFVLSERTRVPARAVESLAERVQQDLPGLF